MRLFISATILSRTSAVWALSSRLLLVNRSASAFATTFATMLRTAGVPRISLVCPSNCGSGRRTVSTAVQTGQDVFLLELLVRADLEPPGVLLDLAANELHESLLEAGLVRAALRRRDDVDVGAEHRVVAGPPAQRDVDLGLTRNLGRDHVAVLLQHGDVLGERAGALDAPGVRQGGVGCEVAHVLRDAAGEPEGLADGFLTALVDDLERETGNEERGLPGTGGEFIHLELGALGEDLPIGPVADARSR